MGNQFRKKSSIVKSDSGNIHILSLVYFNTYRRLFICEGPCCDEIKEIGLYTGDGEFNQLLKLQLGISFYPLPIYFSGEAGFNNRSNGYSDEFHYLAEVGYIFKNKLLLVFRTRGVESLKNENDPTVGDSFGLFANNQRYLTYGPEISYWFYPAFGISAGVEGATRGENVLSAPAFSFGIFLKR